MGISVVIVFIPFRTTIQPAGPYGLADQGRAYGAFYIIPEQTQADCGVHGVVSLLQELRKCTRKWEKPWISACAQSRQLKDHAHSFRPLGNAVVIPAKAHSRQLSGARKQNGHEELEGVTKPTKKNASDAKEIQNHRSLTHAGLTNCIRRLRTKRPKNTKAQRTGNGCFVGLLSLVPGHHSSPQPPLPSDPFAFEKY